MWSCDAYRPVQHTSCTHHTLQTIWRFLCLDYIELIPAASIRALRQTEIKSIEYLLPSLVLKPAMMKATLLVLFAAVALAQYSSTSYSGSSYGSSAYTDAFNAVDALK